MSTNRRVILAERPRYIMPTASCFRMDTGPMPADPQDGEVRVRTLWLAMESTLYAKVQRITALQRDPVKLKDPMVGSAIGRVEASRHPRFKVGDHVSGFWNWQDYAVCKGERLRNLDFGPQKLSYALGAFGLAGFGAYIAVDTLARPNEGETVVVGTALGSLGHLAGQIAKIYGGRVVGIAGNPEKCQLAVEKCGLDACINRDAKDFEAQLKAACPQGVGVYIETLGGRALDAVVPLLNINARIAAVGQATTAQIGGDTHQGRCQNTMTFMQEVISRRLTVRGLITQDHVKGRVKEFDTKMKAWIDEGRVKPMEDIAVGLENAPDAFQHVFEGRNRGTRLVKVAD
ncbi:MAG: zinc-binding dehydrogenase [Panacagrimonas sp.]